MSKEINYGKYLIPNSIKKLTKINEDLKKLKHEWNEVCNLGYIHLNLITDDYRCSITPPDLITFAVTGGDGIHFGFLSDFGVVKDLEQAPIVCVSPTNDPPLKIVARNINEFISLLCIVKDAEKLDNINFYHSEKDFMSYIDEYKEDKVKHKTIKTIILKLHQGFNIQEIPHLFEYWDMIRKERDAEVCIKTLDGIGVRNGSNLKSYKPYDFQWQNLTSIKKYLSACSYQEKLAFFRDVLYSIVINSKDNSEIKDLVVEEMKKVGLADEAARISNLKPV